jgi:ribosomal protein S18 acetylase RimI-like enzyme
MSKISYRKATLKDVETLARLRVTFINEVFKIKVSKDAEKLRKELAEYFTITLSDQSVIAWIAEYKNRIVSTSTLVVWHAPPTYTGLGKKGMRGYILNMYTKKEFRKKGIASVLLDKLITEAKVLDLEYVHLHSTEAGIGIYRKLGFMDSKFPELNLVIE